MKLKDFSLKKIELSLLVLPCSLISIFGMSKESLFPQMAKVKKIKFTIIIS